jgi:signal peptidase I
MSDPIHQTPTSSAISEQERADALRRVNRSRGRTWRVMWEWAKSFQVAILVFLFVRAFIVEAFKIPSGSMERTLLVGDFLLVNKLVYGAEVPFVGKRLPALREPRLGDVVVFQWPQDVSKNFVKRLVGMPGDGAAPWRAWPRDRRVPERSAASPPSCARPVRPPRAPPSRTPTALASAPFKQP